MNVQLGDKIMIIGNPINHSMTIDGLTGIVTDIYRNDVRVYVDHPHFEQYPMWYVLKSDIAYIVERDGERLV